MIRITATETVITMNKSTALRHEEKHQISLREDLVLSQRLQKLFAHDSHSDADGTYRVTSLYFDTPYDSALREKIDGVNRREKFRLRYYGTDTSFIRLEKKFKENGLCGKRSTQITEEEARWILSGDYKFLLERGDPLLVELYSKLMGKGLRPKTVVCYDREAFLYAPGNVRITLDRDIRSGLGSVDFLNSAIIYLPVMEQCTILEIKYDAFLPELIRMAVQVPGRRATACSKYAVCRRFD